MTFAGGNCSFILRQQHYL